MDLLQIYHAVILGFIEGFTEFLPISSTGHLIIAEKILGFESDPGKSFEVAIQLGAIIAAMIYFREKIISLIAGLFSKGEDRAISFKFAGNIIVAMLPAVVIGGFGINYIKQNLYNDTIVAYALLFGGIALILIEKYKPRTKYNDMLTLMPKTVLIIGFGQALAMIPGVSRSGATIMTGLLLGLERRTAAEFSFFLAMPTMLAATFYDVLRHYHLMSIENIYTTLVGFLVAFLSGFIFIKLFFAIISRYDFKIFGYYRIIIGVTLLYFI